MNKKAIMMGAFAFALIGSMTAQAALVGEWTFDSQTFVNSGTAGSIHDGTFVTGNSGYFSTDTATGNGYSLRIQSIAEDDSTAGGDVLLINNSKTTDAGYINTFDGSTFSVSMWVKTEDAAWFQWDEFAGKSLESGVKDGWALRSKYGDTIRFDSYDDGSKAESSTDSLDESWHLVTATVDGAAGDMKLYIDGELESTDSSAAISDASLYSLAFGARADGSRGENMLIDELQFYDTELTAVEVMALYRGVSLTDGGNPIITHIYTADPSAHVWADGKMWIYPSHDQDDATSYASMNGHHVFSSEDLVSWTDHGEIMHTDDIGWARSGNLWAPDCAVKDGTYYYYYPARDSDNQNRVGVATSSSPSGPFTDSGSYIEGTDEIDPACFIDDDGQAYLYWGGHYGDLRIVQLNDDMKTHNGVTELTIPDFYEAPWMHKRNGIYYLSYATGVNDPIAYCTSTSPMGPFTYRGVILAAIPDCATNHHSIVKYKGRWYMFYHSVALSGRSNRRSVCIDYLYYNEDGTIQEVIQTDEGVAAVSLEDNQDNYPFVQAENYTSASGVAIQSCSDTNGGEMVEFLEVGAELSFDLDIYQIDRHDVDFRVSSEHATIAFDLYDGTTRIGSVSHAATGSDQTWETLTVWLPFDIGSMDLRVVATGGGWNLNWIEFSTEFALPAELVGEWTFDSQSFVNSGTAGSVHDGTFVTANTGYFSTDTVSGHGYSLRIQSKAEHDSTTGGDVLLINNSKTTDAGYINTFDGAAFTVSMWVKTEDADWFQWDEFAGKSLESGVKDGWALRSRHGDTIRFDSYGDRTAESATDALDQSWHLITATYDGIASNMNLYIDGVLEDSGPSASISDASLYSLAFGARENGSRGENILIDELQYYDNDLSAAEIEDLFSRYDPPETPPGELYSTLSNMAVALDWEASENADGYDVKRSTVSGSDYVSIGTATGLTYTDTTVEADQTYYYVVSATNGVGESGNSDEVTGVGVPYDIIGTENTYKDNPALTKDNLFDHDITTYFDGADDDGWAGLDFGLNNEQRITQIDYVLRNWSSAIDQTINATFQGANSADFSDAVTLYTVPSDVAGYPAVNTATITASTGYRYLRMLAQPGVPLYGVAELDVTSEGEAFSLASPFQNGMVVQRDKPVTVWGWADSGAVMTIEMNGSSVTATTDADGRWTADLPAMVYGGPYEMTVSTGGQTQTLTDVLVGDVWIVFGQSNMAYALSRIDGADAYIDDIANNDLPIRCLQVAQAAATSPQETGAMEWLDNSDPGAWGAVGTVFAYENYKATGVPSAIIWTAWSSSSIEGWMPVQMTNDFPHFDAIMQDYYANDEATVEAMLDGTEAYNEVYLRTRPNVIYNQMMHPLLDYDISGFVWYQGESNADTLEDATQYGSTLPAFVTEYRSLFDEGDLPFLGVQLPSYDSTYWPEFREFQNQLLTLSNAYVAVTIDTGLSGNIHPSDKAPIGERLSLLAQKYVYDEAIEAHGPTFSSMSRNGSDVTVSFTSATGLTTDDAASPTAFEIAGVDGVFYAATSEGISGSDVVISSSSVAVPVNIRYAWLPYAKDSINLVNSVGLPAAPFRTQIVVNLKADDQSINVTKNTSKVITLTGSDTGNPPLTYALETDPANGNLSGTVPNLTYTPDVDFTGADSFTFTVNNGTYDSAPATVSIGVYEPLPPQTPPDGLYSTLSKMAVALDWESSENSDGYDVKRSVVSGSGYVSIGNTTGLTYTDTTVEADQTYYYVVSATNGFGASANSDVVTGAGVPYDIIGTEDTYRDNPALTKDNLFDHDITTYFDGADKNGWAGLDFGLNNEQQITQIDYVLRDWSASIERTTNATFQGANLANFSDAVTLYTVPSDVAGYPAVNTATITDPTAYRYIRLLAQPGRPLYGVAELDITSVAVATPNGTPVSWLTSHGLTSEDDELDTDGDGLLNWEEYIAGTIPTNAASVLKITSASNTGGNAQVRWQSVTGKTYNLYTNWNLVTGSFNMATSGVPGEVGETSITLESTPDTLFFEVEVE